MPHVTGDPIESPAEPAGIVRASVDIAAPTADVFRALVEPRELAAWLGGEPMPEDPRDQEPDHRTTPRPGTTWRAPALAPDGTSGTVAGEYLVVLPPHALETTWRASWNDFATERVRFQLLPLDVGGVAPWSGRSSRGSAGIGSPPSQAASSRGSTRARNTSAGGAAMSTDARTIPAGSAGDSIGSPVT
jgi:uncharacterized protein YndB with AHSA1/START domain